MNLIGGQQLAYARALATIFSEKDSQATLMESAVILFKPSLMKSVSTSKTDREPPI